MPPALLSQDLPVAIDRLAAADRLARVAFEAAAADDTDFAFPSETVARLAEMRFLLAPFPVRNGGEGFAIGAEAARTLNPILRRLGGGSLPLGRLYEGHVNAVGLLCRFGSEQQITGFAREAAAGALFGVWNTDDQKGLRLVAGAAGLRLSGRKILCSGAGFLERPVVTARDETGRLLMVVPRLTRGERTDLSSWTAQGMRASATGTVDFTDVRVSPDEVIGRDGDYHHQPGFSGGAWRFAAVHQGGMAALLDLLRRHLVSTGRGDDPHQSARLGQATIAVETARLWVDRAATVAETGSADAEAIVAYVNLARLAVERAGLDVMELVHRSVGLASFMRPNPIERISRDLATYLRQPAPDRALAGAATWVLHQDAGISDLWP